MNNNHITTNQSKLIADACERKRLAIFAEMGLGKTKIAYDILRTMPDGLSVVICPLSVVNTWLAEATKWDVSPQPIVYYGTPNRRKKILENVATRSQAILIIPYSLLLDQQLQKIKKINTLILDESAFIKNWQAQRTKRAHALGRISERVYLLSGNPMPNNILDLYGQFRVLGILTESLTQFKARYAILGFWGEVIAPKNFDELLSRIRPHMITATRAEWQIELPPLREKVIRITPDELELREYRRMKTQHYCEANGQTIVAMTASVNKLRTLCDGFVYAHDADECEAAREIRPFSQTTKFKVFKSIFDLKMREHDQLIVWTAWRFSRQSLLALLDDATDDIHAFLQRQYKILVINPSAGGYGLNFQNATCQFFYDMIFSYGDYSQAIARSHRLGVQREVEVFYLFHQGLIEEKIYGVLRLKGGENEKIMRVYKEEFSAAAAQQQQQQQQQQHHLF